MNRRIKDARIQLDVVEARRQKKQNNRIDSGVKKQRAEIREVKDMT